MRGVCACVQEQSQPSTQWPESGAVAQHEATSMTLCSLITPWLLHSSCTHHTAVVHVSHYFRLVWSA